MDIKLIRAFIASPGGLEAERQAAFAAAEEVNRSVARPLGGRLELIGWEETLSGIGRPQAIINADMETCDLFIGVMWTSWGSRPSQDGPYSSGFEEEFSLSFDRHQATQSPLMAMFFKEIEAERQRDPGEELKKVLAFQEKLRAERSLLYNVFTDAGHFASKVREFLSSHVIKMLKPEPTLPAEQKKPGGQPTDENAQPAGNMRASASEVEFLKQYVRLHEAGDDPSLADVARLRLVAGTSGKSQNDKQLIGVHDANILYNQQVEFSFIEQRGLLSRGLASIDNENAPLWSWLALVEAERPGALSLSSVLGEESERLGALIVMRLLGEPVQAVAGVSPNKIVEFWFDDDTPKAVRNAALRYLESHGSAAHLPSVQREIDRASQDTSDAALVAMIGMLLRTDELAAARYLLSASFESMKNAVLVEGLSHFADLASDEVLVGLDHRAPRVRAESVSVLSKRSALSYETIDRALDDEAAIVRLEAVRARERIGQPLSLDEAETVMVRAQSRPRGLLFAQPSADPVGKTLFGRYRAEKLRLLTVAALQPLLDHPSHRHEARRVLALRDPVQTGPALREHLKHGYVKYVAENWPDGFKPESSTVLGGLMLGASATPDDMAATKARDLVREGLEVVVGQRDKADLGLVRDLLDQYNISPTIPVIAYLKALGSKDDIDRLARTSRFSWYGIVQEDLEGEFAAAANAILKLAEDFGDLLGRPLPEEMRAKLIQLVPAAEFARLSDQDILSNLVTDDHLVRRATAMKISYSLSRGRIRKLLLAYKADEKGIYYQVTHWLDLGLSYSRSTARHVVHAKLS
ncbi:hypothetical protein U5A82_02805 [Sphingobium sp. CR2-8]|uniref:HEAT repeat domain-containing protein n=1 Tax=Sphingobium sp. CR2-8 TaxID=1306534 RepID=UPI002DBD511E|nr:hypothetical protein [Sphingobium sp. CR2-8]MEC3909439.1 hypothetical protein [Sphingobium sp. CR2-8]